tara:strand:+ start:35482 stop:36042 length:561 start_codon:yes stop_codon:yes gene_type:complete
MPKISEIEGTPNPNALKFVLKEPLTWGVTHSYDNAEQAKNDPLASELFEIDHVTNIFYVDHWITITQDGGANWEDLKREVADPIRAAPAAHIKSEDTLVTSSNARSNLNTKDQLRLDRINNLLDEEVRPYLQGDGGDLYVVGLEDNVLSVHYQGACGSCPSSISGTLRGIEGLLRSIEPDIEIVAV